MFIIGSKKFPWPYNLLIDLHDINYKTPLDEKELRGSIEYVLNVVNAPDEDIHLLRLHFQEGQSLNQIARTCGVDSSRVRKRIVGVLSIISRTQWLMDILEMGVKAYSQRTFVETGKEAFKKAVEEAKNQEQEPEAPPEIFAFDDTTEISSLNLSARTYNCLLRGGFKKIEDVLDVESVDQLMRIRNMGVKCIEELISNLEEHGYNVDHWKATEQYQGVIDNE